MEENYHITRRSSNKKTGPIPVSISPRCTCPDSCPFNRNGCYADSGPLRLHWDATTRGERGVSFKDLCSEIAKLPAGQLWRHNQAGDLPGEGDKICSKDMAQLILANTGKRGFTYTHKPPTHDNLYLVEAANKFGFTVNLSANSLEHADELSVHGQPVVTVLPSDHVNLRSCTTPQGRKVVVCPATRSDVINCSKCALCQKADRNFIIGFPAHGNSHRKVDAVARQVSSTTTQASI